MLVAIATTFGILGLIATPGLIAEHLESRKKAQAR